VSSIPATATPSDRPVSRLFRVLMNPSVDRAIAALALVPIIYFAYWRYHRFGLTFPLISYLIVTLVLILTMLFRRPPKRITPNPWFWLLAFVNTYFPLAIFPFFDRGRPIVAGGVSDAIALCALLFTLWARFSLGRNIGFVPAQRELVATGAYALVRHPIYTGIMLNLAAAALRIYSTRNITLLGLAVFWMLVKSFVEESFLRADPLYAEYMTKVRARWIPFLV